MLHPNWERDTVSQLYREYRFILSQHKVSLRPVVIQLIDSQTHWGQWDPLTRRISIARRLVREYSWFYVQAILKHEMAHQLVHDVYGTQADQQGPHGEWFKLACHRLGVMNEFSQASVEIQETPLDWRKERKAEVSHRLLDKVQKLLALATSSNEHEAVLAMEKVRELYAKYNLEQATVSQPKNFVHLSICTGKKRLESYQDRILSILVGHFFVEVVTTRLFDAEKNDYFKMIEIIGTRENALMAEYVYHFLLQQSDFWVRETLKKSGKKISRFDRKSLKLGLLEGFSEKLAAAEKGHPPGISNPGNSLKTPTSQALTVVGTALTQFRKDTALKTYLSTIYPRVSYRSTSQQTIDPSYYQVGKTIGKSITLNQAVAAQSQSSGRLLKG